MNKIRNKRSTSLYRFTHKNHNLTEDEIIEIEDLFLGTDELPNGYYVVNPIKSPETVEEIIHKYYPLLTLNDYTLRVWLSFNQFIAPLDDITDNRLINVNTMRFDIICPDGFLNEPFKEDRILGIAHYVNLFKQGLIAISIDKRKMNDKIQRYKIKESSELVEVLCHCIYLFYFSTASIIDGHNMSIGKQWDTNSFHEHFTVYMLYGFIAHHSSLGFKTPLDVWAKVFRIEFNQEILDKIVKTPKERVPELIYQFCQHLDKYFEGEDKALNYALSKLTVNRFSL